MLATVFAFFFSFFRTLVQMPGSGRLGPDQVPLIEDLETANNTEHQVLETDQAGGVAYVDRFGALNQVESSDVQVNSALIAPVFTNYLTLTTPNVPAGQYLISWSYNVRHDNIANDWAVLVQTQGLDAETLNMKNGPGWDAEEAIDPGIDQAAPQHGEREVSWIAGVHTVVLEFANQVGGTTDMKRAELRIWRVGQ